MIGSGGSAVGAVVDQEVNLDVIVGVEIAGVDSEEPGAGVESAVVHDFFKYAARVDAGIDGGDFVYRPFALFVDYPQDRGTHPSGTCYSGRVDPGPVDC